MNKTCTLIVVMLCCFSVNAQVRDVQRFEGGVHIGLTVPVGSYNDGKTVIGAGTGLELRYNIPSSSWDCGVLINATTAVRRFSWVDTWTNILYNDIEQSNRSVNFALVGDYNFGQGKKVNPYAGLGVGITDYAALNDVLYDVSGSGFVVLPRVGVELFHHVRIGLTSMFHRKGFNNCEFSIGVVIGGRPKKAK